MRTDKQVIEQMLEKTGIIINGNNPWDLKVNNPLLYKRILSQGSLGLGEAYMEGWWDCTALDEFFFRVFKLKLDKDIPFNWKTFFYMLRARLFNQQTKFKSKEVAMKHYDIGNDIYQKMLDKLMIYSCAYWKNAKDIDEAQEKKLDLICRKLKLEPGMSLLDIGCGWGGLARYAAERYGVLVVGITLSEEQLAIARQVNQGLPVEIRLQDYRDLHEKFDRIVSVGMFEHVGYKNYSTLMKIASENLVDDGIFLLHTIGGNESVNSTDPWINKYIFPNSMLPSIEQIAKAIKGRFIMEDWHNFGVYYDRTCMEWLKKFEEHWPELHKNYDDAFYRMWKYYLCASAASFRARKNNLWQIVLTKQQRLESYISIR
jgi:cyclopropane-fatty-acyl-phospholipid synthase